MLRFSEVFEQYDFTVEDLFHEALLGNLTIYAQTPPKMKVEMVASMAKVILNRAFGRVVGNYTKAEEEYFCELIPELKELFESGEKFQKSGEILNEENRAEIEGKVELIYARLSKIIASFSNNIPQEIPQEVYSVGGIFTLYPNKGFYKPIYFQQITSPSPISLFSIYAYQQGLDEFFFLKPASNITIPDNYKEEYFIIPNSAVKLGELLEENKLFVMKNELQKLLRKNIRLSDLIPKGNGDKKKFISSRQQLSLIEAIGEYGCTVDELFHEAAHGNLTIYFQTPLNWKVGGLKSIKSAVLQSSLGVIKQYSQEQVEDIYPEIKNAKTPEERLDVIDKATKRFEELSTSGVNPEDYNDQEVYYLPPMTVYPNNGKFRAVYVLPIDNPCRISPLTFANYLKGEANPIIVTQLNEGVKVLDKVFDDPREEFIIFPETEITILESLEDGKLFVMKAEMQKFLPQDSSVHAEVKSEVMPNAVPVQAAPDTKDISPIAPSQSAVEKSSIGKESGAGNKTVKVPRAKTLECHGLWQQMADEIKKKVLPKSSSISASYIALKISKELKEKRSPCQASQNTIRQQIKV